MTREMVLSRGVIYELVAQPASDSIFITGVRKLIADRSIILQSMPKAGGQLKLVSRTV